MLRRCMWVMVGVLLICRAAAAPAETIMVPMRDGVRLATEVLLPETGGPAFPVVLVRTVYGRKYDGIARTARQLGIAVVSQDTRGYGDSEGEKMQFAADGADKLRDGDDTLTWIKSQPWCNGKVGTWGSSALGITQVLLAPIRNDIACQMIVVAPSSMFPVFQRGGVPQKLLPERYAKTMGHEKWFAEQRGKHPTYDEAWRLQDSDSRVANITAPAVHVGGWFDFYPQGTLNGFAARQYLGGPGARGNQKLVLGPWEHAIAPKVGDLTFPNHAFDFNALAWRFFRHWLQDDSDNVMQEPAVHYYVMGDCDDPSAPGNRWRTADHWPPFPTRETAYYLSSDGALVSGRDAVQAGQRAYDFDPASPCPSLGGADASKPLPLDQRSLSTRGDVLKFATAPLTEPLEVTGPVRVKLFVTSDAPDTDFTAKLVDIYPDGREIAILNGIQRVKFRGGFEKADPLPAGTVGELTLDCWSTSIIFNKGHRIGVQISSSNWPRYEVNPNTGEDLPRYTGQSPEGDWIVDAKSVRVAHNTVLMDPRHPSAIILPVAPPNPPESQLARPAPGAATNMPKPSPQRQRLQKPRIQPVRKEAWTDQQRAILEPLEKTGRLYNVFTTMANHPALAADWMVFARHVLNQNSLPARDREIVIIRIGWLCQAEYEWAQHVRIGKAAGLTDAEIRAISAGPEAPDWSEHDRLLLQAADELHADAFISDPTWQGLTKTYTPQQMMDLVFTIGQYNLVSMALNSFGVQLDEGLEGFAK